MRGRTSAPGTPAQAALGLGAALAGAVIVAATDDFTTAWLAVFGLGALAGLVLGWWWLVALSPVPYAIGILFALETDRIAFLGEGWQQAAVLLAFSWFAGVAIAVGLRTVTRLLIH